MSPTMTAVACPECGNADRLTPAEMRDSDGKLKRIRWTCNPCGHVWNDPPLPAAAPAPKPAPAPSPVADTRMEPVVPPAPDPVPAPVAPPAATVPVVPAPVALTTTAMAERLRADHAAITERLAWHRREVERLEHAEAALDMAATYYEGEATGTATNG